jgi:hypothetical protein
LFNRITLPLAPVIERVVLPKTSCQQLPALKIDIG